MVCFSGLLKRKMANAPPLLSLTHDMTPHTSQSIPDPQTDLNIGLRAARTIAQFHIAIDVVGENTSIHKEMWNKHFPARDVID